MNTSGEITHLLCADADVIKLDQLYFPYPWTETQWMELNPDHHLIYSWKLDGKLIGFGLLGFVPGDDSAHLLKILITPSNQSSGFGKVFWSAIVSSLKDKGINKVFLEVESANKQAILFYEKSGFSLVHKRKAYYSNGEDANFMSLTL